MGFASLRFSVADGIGRITLARPERGNPFDDVFAREAAAGRRNLLGSRRSPRRSDRCGGTPLQLRRRPQAARPEPGRPLPLRGAAAAGSSSPASPPSRAPTPPVVCAVQGVVAGGGVGLVSSADIVLAGPEARFAAAFSAIGLCADSGGSYFLPRRVGSARATEFFLLNETWSAERAQALGLVNRIVPAADLAATALDLAATFARGPTRGYGETRRLLLGSLSATLEDQLAREGKPIARLIRTDDAWEGINALLGKRAPRFTGS